MNEIQINNQNLQVKEYQEKRVVTFKGIDAVHNNGEGIARKNFTRNKSRFIKDEDYFVVTKKELGDNLSQSYGFGKNASSGTLLTESGYLMIVKSLTDDLAWQVQRELVKNYFRVKKQSVITVEKGIPQPIKLERKIYKGNPVLTLKDIELVAGISRFNTSYYLSESKTFNFVEGIDFDVLKGANLKRYKVQNGLEGSIISSLTIVFKSAIDKFTDQGYITSPEAIKTLTDYFAENNTKEATAIEVMGVSFLEQIQAFKIVSEDLNMGIQEKVRAYKHIYESNGLKTLSIWVYTTTKN